MIIKRLKTKDSWFFVYKWKFERSLRSIVLFNSSTLMHTSESIDVVNYVYRNIGKRERETIYFYISYMHVHSSWSINIQETLLYSLTWSLFLWCNTFVLPSSLSPVNWIDVQNEYHLCCPLKGKKRKEFEYTCIYTLSCVLLCWMLQVYNERHNEPCIKWQINVRSQHENWWVIRCKEREKKNRERKKKDINAFTVVAAGTIVHGE